MLVVCFRCEWCALDASGVLQMLVVCFRCEWCALDASGVLQMRVVCFRCEWCALDASAHLPVLAQKTELGLMVQIPPGRKPMM